MILLELWGNLTIFASIIAALVLFRIASHAIHKGVFYCMGGVMIATSLFGLMTSVNVNIDSILYPFRLVLIVATLVFAIRTMNK